MTKNKEKNILESIFDTSELDQLLDPYRMSLSEYINAELAGENVDLKFPEIAKMLNTFDELRSDYEDLKGHMERERSNTLVESSFPSKFDLQSIKNTEKNHSNIWQELVNSGRKTFELFESIKLKIEKGLIEIKSMPPQIQITMVPLQAVRSDAQKETPKLLIPNPNGSEDLAEVTLLSLSESSQIVVKLLDSSGDEPTKRVIKLLNEQKSTLQSLITNRLGEAVFYINESGSYYVSIRDEADILIGIEVNISDELDA